MTPLSDLIARLEAAKEGSADLDIEISELLHPDEVAEGETVSIIRYTRSLDAALTLVPEGWHWNAGYDPPSRGRTGNYAQLFKDDDNQAEEAWFAGTVALALCIAALKAKASK